MRNYKLDKEYLIGSKRISKGAQKKYFRDGYYYKVNNNGNEGLTEYLVYRLLANSTVNKDMIVKYEYCKINSKTGCRSKNFLDEHESFITMYEMYKRATGSNNLQGTLLSIDTPENRIEYILELASYFGIDRTVYREYMKMILQLDMLVRNTDRHPSNYGVIYNEYTGKFRMAPLFDNGNSLDTDRTGNNASCTIGGSFEQQVLAFGFPVKASFKIYYSSLKKDIDRIENMYGRKHEIDVLNIQLRAYEDLFRLR